MATHRTGNGGNGNFIAWLQSNLAELKKLSAAHEVRMQAHETRMQAHESRMDDLERWIGIQARELIETRRQTREIVALLSRMDRRIVRLERGRGR